MNKRRGITLVILLVLWQISALVINKTAIIPFPYDVLKVMLKQLSDVSFYKALLATLTRMLIGLLTATLFAVILGFISGLNEKFEHYFSVINDIIKTIPNVSYIIVILIWLGSEVSVTVITFFILFPNIYSNVLLGIKSLPKGQRDVMRVYPAPLWICIRDVYWPQTVPYLLASIKVSFGLGFKVSVMAEILGAVRVGIGKGISYARTYVEMETIFAYTIWIIILSALVEKLFDLAISKIKK